MSQFQSMCRPWLLLLPVLVNRVAAFSPSLSPTARTVVVLHQKPNSQAATKGTSAKRLSVSATGNNSNDDQSYVPSGLTREEYNRIKQRDADKMAKMNFGAWGPRFLQQSSAPQGDWFVMPQLWMTGVSANNMKEMNDPSTRASRLRRVSNGMSTMLAQMKQMLPYFVIAYMALDMALALILSICNSPQKCLRAAAVFPFQFIIYNCHSLYPSMMTFRYAMIAKALISAALTPRYEAFVDWASRKRLWTPRRVLTLSALSAMVIASTASVLATAMARFFKFLTPA